MRGFARQGVPFCFLVAMGCSHTWYQFTVTPNELAHIDNTKNLLATSYRDDAALAQVVDLPGRRAVETLMAGMATERTAGDEQFQRLLRVLTIGVMGDNENPMSWLDSDISLTAARVGQRVVADQAQQLGLGGLVEMAGAMLGTDSDGQRLAEMRTSLSQGRVETCAAPDVIVSYIAGILGHVHTRLTDDDANYQDWQGRVRAIHLVRFQCQPQHALMVLTRNRDEAGLRVIGWHFATSEQWEEMRPEIRRTFDLPRTP